MLFIKAKALSTNGEIEFSDILAGVQQSETLPSYLFIIFGCAVGKTLNGMEEELGYQIRRRQSKRIPPECITDLDFADDIMLISEQIKQAQTLLDRVESETADFGLMANPKKIKVMTFNCPKKLDTKQVMALFSMK